MAFSLPLPPRLKQWKVKIHDLERVEPPHVHILRKTESWRVDLRTGGFLDAEPDPAQVPADVREVIEANMQTLRAAWDSMYPENPV
jgi:Domain of unknown function (DUF4160)